MTSTLTTVETFASQALAGFVRAHEDRISLVDGGVVLQSRRRGQVAIVTGGGSGHYPAFAGMVGTGMATAAVCGDIFASPSSGQVVRVTQAADTEAGALLIYGNYMGDVLNFSHAQEKLKSLGMDVRTVRVADDVVSAPPAESRSRRGVAGDLFVIKIAGASAFRGDDLDTVEKLAQRASDAIYTLGVAFSGCTLPGAAERLFEVPEGKMALGLGIHGEPGIGELDLPTPEELARILVRRILEEPAPMPGKRVTVILNGLGAMKYEELFCVYNVVADELTGRGFEVLLPEVGELVTSLDMNGCSLSIAWLDEELESLWRASCDAPGFSRLVLEKNKDVTNYSPKSKSTMDKAFREPEGSAAYIPILQAVFAGMAEEMVEAEKELGLLDAQTGDGDHGIGMVRGARGAHTAVSKMVCSGSVELLSVAAGGWSEAGGGTSGAIWGILLGSMATSLSQATSMSARSVSDALIYAATNVQDIGGARLGDKTLVDVLTPFSESFALCVDRGRTVGQAWQESSLEADLNAKKTANLVPKIGRAKNHAERGIGVPDAGAISLALLVARVGKILEKTGVGND